MKLSPTLGRITDSQIAESSSLAFKSSLKVGEVLKGLVVRALDNKQFVISFKGHQLITEMDFPLKRGQEIQAKVVSLGENIRMSFMPATTTNGFSPEVVALLDQANFPVSQQTHDFAQILYQHKLPIDSKTLNSLIQYGQQANFPMGGDHNVLVTGWLLNLPSGSHLFQALQNLYYRREKLDFSLRALKNALNYSMQSPTDSVIDKTLVQEFLETINPLDFGTKNLAKQLSEFANGLGLSYERKLFLASQKQKNTQGFLQEKTLKANLLRLKSQFSPSTQLPDDSSSRIGKAIDSMLLQIDTLELAMNPLIAGRSQVYLQIPYASIKKDLSADVLGYSPDDESKLSIENMRLEMSIETENLGCLRVNLHILQRQMNCLIMSEEQRFSDFIIDEKIDLLERMQSIRYNLNNVAFQVVDLSKIEMEVVPRISRSAGNVGRIDVSA